MTDKPVITTPNNKLTRWDPFELLEDVQREFAKRWNLAWPPLTRALPAITTSKGWLPAMDLFEKEGKLVAQVELPGLRKEDLHVTLDDGDLVVRGERKAESEVKEDAYYRLERSYGSFYRRLSLPFPVKPEDVRANFKDGVLEIELPKPATAEAKVQQIEVT